MKDVFTRAMKTFWQAALATLVVSAEQLAGVPLSWESMKPVILSICVGALAAGFSAVYNGVVKPLLGGGSNGDKK